MIRFAAEDTGFPRDGWMVVTPTDEERREALRLLAAMEQERSIRRGRRKGKRS